MNAPKIKSVVGLVTLLILMLGCATTEYHKASVLDNKSDPNVYKSDLNVNGIRYYRPATYMLVKPDYDKQQASVEFWSGPDTSMMYAVDPSAWAATNTTELKFSRGMLIDVSSATDSTKIATETIAALGEVAKSVLEKAAKAASLAAAALVSPERGGEQPPIFLFVITTDGQFKQIYGPAPQVQ